MFFVAKFGGSSLANASQFKKVKDIVLSDERRRLVVVSALGKRNKDDSKITDLLYLLHAHTRYSVPGDNIFNMVKERYLEVKNELGLKFDVEAEFDEIAKRLTKDVVVDYIVSRGEYITAKIMAEYLGFTFVDAKDVIVFGYDGLIDQEKTSQLIDANFRKYGKIVIPGFYGAYPNGVIKLLSRGGSDITGSLAAKAIKASMYENWTDVSGILMADPRIVDKPKRIKQITYSELRELAYMGANVLHEETIFPVQESNIPINILNTNDPTNSGTVITQDCDDESQIITGIAGKKNFTSFTITKSHLCSKVSIIRQILQIFEKYKVNVEHIPSSIDSFSIIVNSEDVEKCIYDLVSDIKKEKDVSDVQITDQIALVAVVGRNMAKRPGISGKLFATIGNNEINIKTIAQGLQELNIIVGVDNRDFEKTIKVIYENFVA